MTGARACAPCVVCGSPCRLRLAGLHDDRHGHPGRYDLLECDGCGHRQLDAAFSDADLARAFGTYNVLRAKVHVDGPIQAEQGPPRGLVATLKTFLTNKRP